MRGRDDFPVILEPLGGIPQIEIDQHTAYGHVHPTLSSHDRGTSHLFVLVSKCEDLISDSFHCNDTRSPDAHFLFGPVFEVVARFEEGEEGRWVRKDFEVMEDLWDAVVGEHGQLVYAPAREYGMWNLVGRWGGEECGPRFCDQDLGSFEEVY